MQTQETEQEQHDRFLKNYTALQKACNKSHKGGPGGAAVCVCGAGGGGSEACGALRVLRDIVRYVNVNELSDKNMRDWILKVRKVI